MNGLPATDDALVLRTDFSDDDAWSVICAAIRASDPEHGFVAYVDCVSDPDYEGLSAATLVELADGEPSRTYMFVVDSVATHHPEHPGFVLDLSSRPGRTFRVIPAEVGSVETTSRSPTWTSRNSRTVLAPAAPSAASLHIERRSSTPARLVPARPATRIARDETH